MKIELK
jgi:hypothetical protein